MTVPANSGTSTNWLADGINRLWSYSFKAFDASHIQLDITDPAGGITTVTSGFTVTGIGSETGGQVTYPIAPASPVVAGARVQVVLRPPYAQPNRIGSQGEFDAATHEKALDLLTQQVQRLDRDGTARGLAAPYSDGLINMRLPKATLRAGKILEFDEAGRPVASNSIGEIEDHAAALDAVLARRIAAVEALIVQANAGLEPFTVTPEMLGAKRDGVTNDGPKINLALALGLNVKLLPGTYYTEETLRFYVAGTVMEGPRSAIIKPGPALKQVIRFHESNCTIRGFKILGDKPGIYDSTYAAAIYCNRTVYAGPPDPLVPGVPTVSSQVRTAGGIIDRVEVYGWPSYAMRFDYCDFWLVQKCHITFCGTHGVLFACSNHNKVLFNYIADIGPGMYSPTGQAPYYTAYGISFARDPARNTNDAPISYGNLALGNTVRRVRGWIGIDCHGAQSTRILSNKIEECYIGIHLEDGDWTSDGITHTPVAARDVTISDNEIHGNTGTATDANGKIYGIGPGINCDGASNDETARQIGLVVNNNRLFRCGHSKDGFTAYNSGGGRAGAIRVRQAEAPSFGANYIDNPRRYGYLFLDQVQGASVSGGTVRGVLSTPSAVSDSFDTMQAGVYLGDATASVLVDGVMFHGGTGMVGIAGVGGYTGDYGVTLGTNKKFGGMTLTGTGV